MRFHISDVLTVITGYHLSRDGVAGVYRILNYMTGADIYTHQIPRALASCAPVLKAQFPHLAEAETQWSGASTQEDCAAWVAQFEPEYLDVRALDTCENRDPIAEAIGMMGDVTRVIPIRPDDPLNQRN